MNKRPLLIHTYEQEDAAIMDKLRSERLIFKILFMLMAGVLAIICLTGCACASMTPDQWESLRNLHRLEHNHVTQERIVNAIIGEAEGESYQGKLAVAYAIINRGTLKGVYGEHAPRVTGHKYSQSVYNEALMAYKKAFKEPSKDITYGATHWEGTAFKKPVWANEMVMTVQIGHQRFYREC